MAILASKHRLADYSRPDEHIESVAGALALHWAATHPGPRAILDADMHLFWLNNAARDLLGRGNGMAVRDNRLVPVNHDLEADWRAFLLACDGTVRNFPLPCSDSDGHLIFSIRELRRDSEERYIGIAFHHASTNHSATYAELDKVFNLTPAEHRILLMMLDGETASVVAARSHVSIDTVRSHIRHIYMKVGVTSREALFRQLRPYCLESSPRGEPAHTG